MKKKGKAMNKTELLEIWGFLDVLKADYQKRLLENSYFFDEVRKTDEKHFKRIAELQKRITEETEGM